MENFLIFVSKFVGRFHILRSRMDSCSASCHSVLYPHAMLSEVSVDEDS
jgi:hypothetical protein